MIHFHWLIPSSITNIKHAFEAIDRIETMALSVTGTFHELTGFPSLANNKPTMAAKNATAPTSENVSSLH
jgi:hypothetical protein